MTQLLDNNKKLIRQDVGYIVCITIIRFREDPMPFWRFPMRDVG